MVTFPNGFVATKFPGYFWHVPTQSLYSIKIDGVLKPLKITGPNYFNKLTQPAYRVSVQGNRTYLFLSYLQSLTIADSEIPVAGRKS